MVLYFITYTFYPIRANSLASQNTKPCNKSREPNTKKKLTHRKLATQSMWIRNLNFSRNPIVCKLEPTCKYYQLYIYIQPFVATYRRYLQFSSVQNRTVKGIVWGYIIFSASTKTNCWILELSIWLVSKLIGLPLLKRTPHQSKAEACYRQITSFQN